MSVKRLGAVVAILAVAGTAAGSAPSRGAETKTVEVIDPQLRRVAFRLAIPAGWLFDATVVRAGGFPMVVFRTSSTDGTSGMQLLARYDWISANDSTVRQRFAAEGATIRPYMLADTFVTKYLLPEARPGAVVIGREPFPDSMALLAADSRVNAQYQIEMDRRNRRQRTDGARFRIAYDFNGRAVEEVIVAIKTSTRERAIGYLERTVVSVTAARAPRGQLDALMPQLVAMSKSLAADTAWIARQYEVQRRRSDARQAEIAAASRPETKLLSMIDSAPSDAIRARDSWTMVADSSRSTFDYSYVDEKGAVIHTKRTTYDPAADVRAKWIRLQP